MQKKSRRNKCKKNLTIKQKGLVLILEKNSLINLPFILLMMIILLNLKRKKRNKI